MTKQHLHALGIQLWEPRETDMAKTKITPPTIASNDLSNCSWDELRQKVISCVLCPLSKTRINAVFGNGNQHAELLLIGEAPGANEDKQGEPFVGRAGLLLNEMLLSIGIKREDVFVTNVVKCRPPENRDPLPNEVATCAPYLAKQIEFLQPKLIIAVGRVAAQHLLASTETIGKLRSNTHSYGANKIPLAVIYHPAYLLRSPGEKAKAYGDLVKIKQMIF